jgi:hypothetical protein
MPEGQRFFQFTILMPEESKRLHPQDIHCILFFLLSEWSQAFWCHCRVVAASITTSAEDVVNLALFPSPVRYSAAAANVSIIWVRLYNQDTLYGS